MNDVAVTVMCITYNQVQFVERMIKGILSQQTTFEFEVLIHDDASTDGTTELLKEIEQRESLVHLICEANNRFADGIDYFSDEMLARSRGKYIAVCEGDDYWIDELKLQTQYEYMEANPKCTFCAHAAVVFDGGDGSRIGSFGMGSTDLSFSAEDLARCWRIPTASCFYRAEDAMRYSNEWNFDAPVGDFPKAMYMTYHGYGHYSAREASAYTFGAPGSWTSLNRESELRQISSSRAWLSMLESIDLETGGALHSALIENAKSKTIQLVSMLGREAELPYIALEALRAFSLKQKLAVRLLRLLWIMGFKICRKSWSGFHKWSIVRREKA